MEVVVVRVLVPAISLLDSSEKTLQNRGRYFKLVNHTVAIKKIIAQIFHRRAHGGLVQGKHIERPVV
jgi:hypothetical protein